MGHSLQRVLAVIGSLLLVAGAASAQQEPAREMRLVIGHSTVYDAPGEQRIIRVAIGNADRLRVRVPTPRQLLLNARAPGRTNLIVWFHDGSRQSIDVVIERDLAPLYARLTALAPQVKVDTSNDGNALILTGTAPSTAVMEAVVEIASAFAAGLRPVTDGGGGFLLVQVDKEPQEGDPAPATGSAQGEVVASERAPGNVTVINLLTLTRRTETQEVRLEQLLGSVSPGVQVERLQGGLLPGAEDSFLIRGTLRDPNSYMEIMTTAIRFMGGDLASMKVLGEEKTATAAALANAVERGAMVVALEGRLVSHLRATTTRTADPGSPEAVLEADLRRIAPEVVVERLTGPGGDTFVIRGALDDANIYREVLGTAVRLLGSDLDSLRLADDPQVDGRRSALTTAQLRIALLQGLTIVGANGSLLSFMRARQSPALAALADEVARLAPGATVRVIGLREKETYLLEGTAPDPSTLTRLLTVCDKILGGSGDGFRIIADQGGGLLNTAPGPVSVGSAGSAPLNAGTIATLFGQPLPRSDLAHNLSRGMVVTNAQGDLVSMVQVAYFPQVLVSVRIVELDRSHLRQVGIDAQWARPDYMGGLSAPFPANGPLSGAGPGPPLNGRADVLNVLRILSGEARNEFAVVADKFAFDFVVRALEQEGYLKTLAEPALVTLSGEQASFFVGGSAAVSNVVTTNQSTASGFNFIPFGVSLEVRPVVGDDRQITIDVLPSVSELDPTLRLITSDGQNRPPIFSAIRSRTLRTTARLGADQGLLLGGIISRSESEDVRKIPILGDIPLIGHLFRDTVTRTDEREIVIVLFPELVQPQDRRLLQFDLPEGELDMGRPADAHRQGR